MNLLTDGVIRTDDKGPHLTVVLKGAFDLVGVIRGKECTLKGLASVLLVLQDDVLLDNIRMRNGETAIITVARRSTKQLNKSFLAITQADVGDVEWINDEESTVADEDSQECKSV